MYSVDPKATSLSLRMLIYAALPFSRQGVIRAIIGFHFAAFWDAATSRKAGHIIAFSDAAF